MNLNDMIASSTEEMSYSSDNPFSDCPVKIDVVFRNIKEKLIRFIDRSDAIVGCVAWVTDFDILNML